MDFINFNLIQLTVLVHSTIVYVNVYANGTDIAATASADVFMMIVRAYDEDMQSNFCHIDIKQYEYYFF